MYQTLVVVGLLILLVAVLPSQASDLPARVARVFGEGDRVALFACEANLQTRAEAGACCATLSLEQHTRNE